MRPEQIISMIPSIIFFVLAVQVFQMLLRGLQGGTSSFFDFAVLGRLDLPSPGRLMKAAGDVPNESGDDRRRHPRKPFRTFIDFVYKGDLFKNNSRNLSQSGMFIQLPGAWRFKIDSKVTLTFQGPDDSPFKSIARIAQTTPDGIGVEFVKA